ncbi:membrane protein [Actibacterium mucosum KCTC 23349]|uniref:Membrane protein n=1 Tax=Actibacterium mucosum KCTC 23349 TaxID=1454373 RepID=A0A037ZHJ8_9RHOB|nr:DUF2306 domain-containing protein [Actibacterium mucosum]KAJ55012.1 membrane protein [Actibacterium mucosum KCTC 23349]
MTLLAFYRYVFLWFLTLGVALASWRFLVADITVVMSAMMHQLQGAKGAFYAHIFFAPIALAMVPFQFSQKLRANRPGLHRWMGRTYGMSILIAGVAGLIIAPNADGGLFAATGFFVLSVLWLVTTVLAVWHALNRRIPQHRKWMIRSAALTLAAVTLRLQLPLGVPVVGFEFAYPVIAWTCWVPNLIVAEWWLRRRPAALAA